MESHSVRRRRLGLKGARRLAHTLCLGAWPSSHSRLPASFESRSILPLNAQNKGAAFDVASVPPCETVTRPQPWLGIRASKLQRDSLLGMCRGFRQSFNPLLDQQRLSIGTGTAALSFAVLTGTSRWFQGLEGAEVSRYLHVGALLFLPALMVGLAEVAAVVPHAWRPRSFLLPAGAVVLLLPPALVNLGRFEPPLAPPGIAATIQYVAFAAPRSPVGANSPPWVAPIPDYSIVPFVTLGWLREVDQAGMLPPAPPPNRALDDQMHVRLGLGQRFARTDRPCQRSDAPLRVKPSGGGVFAFSWRSTRGAASRPGV